MTNLRKSLLAGAVIAAFASGWAFGQALTSRSLTGLETWAVAIGGPQGPSQFVTSAQFRNSQGVTTTAATTGTLSTLTSTTATLISTAAAGGAMVVNLPALPFDGEIFEWVNGAAGAFTTGNTVATTDGSTIQGSNATGALAAASSIEFRYVLSTNTWYKLR
jgi:hypothetical protein